MNEEEIAEKEQFTDSIPVPEDEIDETKKRPHKVVRYVGDESAQKPAEAEKEPKKGKKKGFMSDFISGVAAGAKVFSDNVKAGAETVSQGISSEKKDGFEQLAEEVADRTEPEEPAVSKPEETVAEPVSEPVHAEEAESEVPVEDETEKEAKPSFIDGIKEKLAGFSNRQIIIGAVGIVAVIVAVILICASSCSKPKPADPVVIDDMPINENGNIVDDEGKEIPLEILERTEKVADAVSINKDVVGWLYIPGLSEVDAGVCHDAKTYSYNKRDITGKNVNSTYWINGAYYAHLRNTFGPSTDDLSRNTVIFGHSDLGSTNLAYADDDPSGPLFSQLFNFKNPDFAAVTPYIYFSTEGGDYVWEVFSVFYNDSSIDGGKALWYIEPEPGNNYPTLLSTVQERSLYNYDVEVTTDDKILTLSTCTVGYGLGSRSRYRFVIVAKLVEDTEGLVERMASFKINPEAPVPPSFQEQFDKYVQDWDITKIELETKEPQSYTDEATGITITESTAA